jgi:hypothetical protein
MHVGSVIQTRADAIGNVRPASVSRPIVHRYEVTFAYDVPAAGSLLELQVGVVPVIIQGTVRFIVPDIAVIDRKRFKVNRLVRYYN